MVKTLLDVRPSPSQAQQDSSTVICEPPQEITTNPSYCDFNGHLHFGLDYQDILNSQFPMPYPNNPAYGSYTDFGFDGASNMPARNATTLSPSEGAMQSAPPQPLTSFPLMARQNGRPCTPTEASGHRLSAQYSSSGLSSQRSRDSGDLRTLGTEETEETQNTQYTSYSQDPQFSQDQDTMLGHQQYHPHTEGGGPGDHAGVCSSSPSVFPAGQYSCNPVITGQGQSDLCGVGGGRTGAFMPRNSLYISNSDEDLSPGADMP